ncbi:MAG: DUF3800 domain-containing protein [Firmicutes bacterium]|jgi:hypothetical protein|nr:DUF3800 domain-containing protein [Bacillota bacterium]
MHIVYFDETGDDGYPGMTNLFVLASCTINAANWLSVEKQIDQFRDQLNNQYGFLPKLEMHTKHFMLNKKPYREYNFDQTKRLEIVKSYASFISTLKISFINTIINKQKIKNGAWGKNILDNAFKYNVQRVYTTLCKTEDNNFIIISDVGRIGAMCNTTRRMKKENIVPSKYSLGSYQRNLDSLIEGPLQKDSKESHFIQLCDFVSYFTDLKLVKQLTEGNWHARLNWLTEDDVETILDTLVPVFNRDANSNQDQYGFVVYPK